MKALMTKKLAQTIFIVLILLIPASKIFAYPPDNAAVLYQRASMIFDANNTMTQKINDFRKGDIGIDEQIEDYIERNKFAIKYFVDAGDVPNCDWGLDYSEGSELLMPQYAPLRNLAIIVAAKAKISADSGDYKQAMELCLSIHKASPHIAEGGILISHLVGVSFNALANEAIIDILPGTSDNPDMLIWLKNQIYDVSQGFPSVKAAINSDLRICSQDISKEKAGKILQMAGDQIPEDERQIIQNADEAFFKANKDYFLNYLNDCLTALDLPYPQSYEQLELLAKKTETESKENNDAIMSTLLTPSLSAVLSLDIRNRTHFNAVKTALSLYVIRAETGQLPDELPEGLPKDLFSGKDFEYERTEDGFILRCQGKNLSRDETHEYEFKVKT